MGWFEADVIIVSYELGCVLQIRVPARDVGLDVVTHDVLVHPLVGVAQDVVGPDEEVVDEC